MSIYYRVSPDWVGERKTSQRSRMKRETGDHRLWNLYPDINPVETDVFPSGTRTNEPRKKAASDDGLSERIAYHSTEPMHVINDSRPSEQSHL